MSDKKMSFSYYAHADDMKQCSMLVDLLAAENSDSIQNILRKLGRQAVEQNDYQSFNMVAKLWKEKEQCH